MGRFFLTLVLALGIGGAVAWYYELGPVSRTPPATNSTGLTETRTVNVGNPLYKLEAPVLQPLGDDPGARRQVVIPDCHINPVDKQDISAAKDGIVILIGELVEAEDVFA